MGISRYRRIGLYSIAGIIVFGIGFASIFAGALLARQILRDGLSATDAGSHAELTLRVSMLEAQLKAVTENSDRLRSLVLAPRASRDQIDGLYMTVAQAPVAAGPMLDDKATNRMPEQLAQTVPDLAAFVRIEMGEISGVLGPHIIFEGANVHFRSGSGATAERGNGLGNVIVGYNETPEQLVAAQRSGMHNLIVGPEHIFSGYGGFVAGFNNTIEGDFASASGGRQNGALGANSSVSGGYGNDAVGENSSVSGGFRNKANGDNSSISGGFNNAADNETASVSGGAGNTARGRSSSVAGGARNTAIGRNSSIAGGGDNIANADTSTVSGGNGNTASGPGASVSGGFGNTASGREASVSGGTGNTASGSTASVGGGSMNTASAVSSSVGGTTAVVDDGPVDAIVAQGLVVFEANCAVCHTSEEGGGNRTGPNLFGVFGSQAGLRDVAERVTSNALKASGLTWNEDTLNSWLSGLPSQFVPGVRMGFTGIENEADRAALIELVKTFR